MRDLAVQALVDDARFDLQLSLIAGEAGLERRINHARIQKPGIALAGYVDSIRPQRVQVLGKTEWTYLGSLSAEARTQALRNFMETDIACVVLSSGLEPTKEMLQEAQSQDVTLLTSPHTTSVLINQLHAFLDAHLSPEQTLHGVLVDIFGVGVLLLGPSGIGKSEAALDLILRGHRLVGDDAILVMNRARELIGMGSPVTRHHMEIRGLGIINVQEMFGAAAVREEKRIELAVEMVSWDNDVEFDRLGLERQQFEILGLALPLTRVPVRPGRNMASLLEVAARYHLLRLQGHDPAADFQKLHQSHLNAGKSTT